MSQSRFVVFDGHGLMWRALHRPGPPLTSPRTGEPTRGTYTFTTTILALLRQFKPDYAVVAGDAPRSTTFRKQLFEGYKSNRPKEDMDDELLLQVRRCKEVVEAIGVQWLVVPEFEADDVIASFADTCANDQVQVIVVSADHDLNQLVGDNVVQYDPVKELMLTRSIVEDTWGVRVEQIEEVMVLAGDSGDGVPGVPGIGLKTAVKLIREYGTVDTLCKCLGDLTPRKAEAISQANLPLTRQLVCLRKDAPLDIAVEDLEFDGVDHNRAAPLFIELGFQSLL